MLTRTALMLTTISLGLWAQEPDRERLDLEKDLSLQLSGSKQVHDLISVLAKRPEVSLVVIGFAPNRELALLRASSVRASLEAQGIPKDRIELGVQIEEKPASKALLRIGSEAVLPGTPQQAPRQLSEKPTETLVANLGATQVPKEPTSRLVIHAPSKGAPIPGTPFLVPVLKTNPDLSKKQDLSSWEETLLVEDAFGAWSPDDKGQAPVQTNVRLGWGTDGLYILVEALDPHPEQIRRALQARDSVGEQDIITLNVDPTNAGRSAYLAQVNPLGVQNDARYVEGSGTDYSFDFLWDSVAYLSPNGWIAKFRIPYSSIQRRPGPWKLRMTRYYPRSDRAYTLAFPKHSLDKACTLCQTVDLLGAPIKTEEAPLLVMPRIYSERKESLGDGTLGKPAAKTTAGMDLRYLGTSYTLEGTYKPDFATVESDVDPVRINDRFRYQYPEKRPFFLEGMDVFRDAGLQILSTRSIIEPTYGVKASGQASWGAWSLLHTRDEKGGNSLDYDGYTTTDGRQTSDVAFGARFNVGTSEHAGKITLATTNRSVLGGPIDGVQNAFSRTTSLTGYEQFTPTISGQAILAQGAFALPTPWGGYAQDGTYSFATVSQSTRNWFWSAAHETMSPDFRMDMGFASYAGYKESLYTASVFDQSNKAWWVYESLGLTYDTIRWWDDTPYRRSLVISPSLTTKGRLAFTLSLAVSGAETFMNKQFDVRTQAFSITYSGLPGQTYGFVASHLLGIDYGKVSRAFDESVSGYWNAQVGTFRGNIQLSHRAIKDYQTKDTNTWANSLYVFIEEVLPHDLFWRVEGQKIRIGYPLDTNPQMLTDHYDTLNYRLLTGWRPMPFAGVYLGYSNIRRTIPTPIDSEHIQTTDKGLFAKVSYVFRF